MAASRGGVVHIPWYATAMRGDKLQGALEEIAPAALRFGASHYELFRMRDDRYKFLQTATFADPLEFERYWYGERFCAWRALNSGYYQVPLIYGWADQLCAGSATVAGSQELVSGAAGPVAPE